MFSLKSPHAWWMEQKTDREDGRFITAMEINTEHDESCFVMFEDGQNEKITPKNFLQLRLPIPDSGYSSLPQSPIKSSETKLNRRSLSLHDAETPFTRKSFCKRVLYRDIQDKLPPGVIKRRNSDPELTKNEDNTNTSKPQEAIDILNVLTPFPHIISKIFSHLNGENLSAVCCVSNTWNQLCKNDKKANEKRRLFLALLVLNKENPKTRNPPQVPPRSGECTPLNNYNQPFALPVVESKSEPTNFERFVEAGTHLPRIHGAFLLKCVRCFSPSKVLPSSPVANCTSPSCCFRFCAHCRCQFTDNHICRVVTMSASASSGGSCSSSTPNMRIGSIGCKRNLRRLRRV